MTSKIEALRGDTTRTIDTTQIEEKPVICPLNASGDGINWYQPTPEQIKQRIAELSRKYGGNFYEVYNVIKCESNFRHANLYGDGGKAFGVAQYHRDTFDKNCKGDYYNANDQLICFFEMFKKGLKNHWSCWRKLLTS